MVDVASVVPSTRDFLQAIATQKKRLVLVPLVDRVDDAVALAAAGVTAFAVASPGSLMRAVSDATGSAPILSLSPIASTDEALLARASGADAVVVDAPGAAAPAGDRVSEVTRWNSLAKDAVSTRMAALALVVDGASASSVATTTARGAYVRAESATNILPLVRKVGSLRTVAHVPSADETALRALRGVVDAAIVESDLYLSTSFDTLREELDP